MLDEFWDEVQGGFFFGGRAMRRSSAGQNLPSTRPFPLALQWPPKISCVSITTLAEKTTLQRVEQIFRLFRRHIEQQPFGCGGCSMLSISTCGNQKRSCWLAILTPPTYKPCCIPCTATIFPIKTVMRLDPRSLEENA